MQAKSHVSKEVNHNKLQIIHCSERNHWITATTIGCESGVIKVYDSLYTILDKPPSIVLANLFHCEDKLFKNRVVRPQKQNGGLDCGVFAIAFATSIAINHKVNTKFDQARMRAHLVSCLEKRIFTVSIKVTIYVLTAHIYIHLYVAFSINCSL